MKLLKSCAKSILNELKVKNLGFSYDQVDQFYRSQWQSGDRSVAYLIFRWIWASFFICVFLACLVLQLSGGKLFIFLTNWGILACLATQIIAAILVTRWHYDIGGVRTQVTDGSAKGTSMTPLVKFYWLLHGISLSLALVITTVYWIFLHGKMTTPVRFPALSFVTHCLNSVFMFTDFLIVGFPQRLLHLLYDMLFPISYSLFTVVYFFCGGSDEYGNPYVYSILNWAYPWRGVATFMGVFGLYIVYDFILFGIFKLKRSLHRYVCAVWTPQIAGLI